MLGMVSYCRGNFFLHKHHVVKALRRYATRGIDGMLRVDLTVSVLQKGPHRRGCDAAPTAVWCGEGQHYRRVYDQFSLHVDLDEEWQRRSGSTSAD
jgi:hypothetical protein